MSSVSMNKYKPNTYLHIITHIAYLHYARISSTFLDYSGKTWSLRYLCARLLSALCCGLIKVTIPVYQEREEKAGQYSYSFVETNIPP